MESLYVIKIGGNIIDDPAVLQGFIQRFADTVKQTSAKFILVHGGGKLATRLAADLGIEQQMIDGRRITDEETLKIVTMVYAGSINKNIVAALQAAGLNAAGFSGADGNIIQAGKRVHASIDYGFVGDVTAVNTQAIQSLLGIFDVLVMAPITHDGKGQLLNTNADTIAQELATGMSAVYASNLIFSFEKPGVLLDVSDESSVIPRLDALSFDTLKVESKIFAGMIPKLENAFSALNKGLKSVVIGKAEELDLLILGKAGTTIAHD